MNKEKKMIGVFLSFLIAVLSWVALNRPENSEYRLAIMVFIVVGFLFGVILTLEHLGVLPLFKDQQSEHTTDLHGVKIDYYCDAVELVKNSKLSDKDKKETLERMERAVMSPPYKIFSKDNFNYLKSRLEELEKNNV